MTTRRTKAPHDILEIGKLYSLHEIRPTDRSCDLLDDKQANLSRKQSVKTSETFINQFNGFFRSSANLPGEKAASSIEAWKKPYNYLNDATS